MLNNLFKPMLFSIFLLEYRFEIFTDDNLDRLFVFVENLSVNPTLELNEADGVIDKILLHNLL